MTLEEYRAIVSEMTADNAPEIVQRLMDNIEQDLNAKADTSAELEKASKRIRELQDTNMKLFMRVGEKGPAEQPEEEKPKTPQELAKEMIEHAFKH